MMNFISYPVVGRAVKLMQLAPKVVYSLAHAGTKKPRFSNGEAGPVLARRDGGVAAIRP
jgi:hypothetical protein